MLNNSKSHKQIYGLLLISLGLCFLLLPHVPAMYYLIGFHSICGIVLIIFANQTSVKFYRIWDFINLLIIVIIIFSLSPSEEKTSLLNILDNELMFIWIEYIIIIILYRFNYDLFWIEPTNIKTDENTIIMKRSLIGTDINDAFYNA